MLKSSGTTLQEARDRVHTQKFHGALKCPCCDQTVKVYKRQINRGIARSLGRMYQLKGLGWVHVPTMIGARSREEGKLAYWGLAEESTEPREDGGRAGWWRVTPRGERFIRGKIRVPKYAYTYNTHCLELDDSKTVSFKECLGEKFDLSILMQS